MKAIDLIKLDPTDIKKYMENLRDFNFQTLYFFNNIPVLIDFTNKTGIDGLEMDWKFNKVRKARKCDLNLPGVGYPYFTIIGPGVLVRIYFGIGGEISVTKIYDGLKIY